MNGMTIFKHIIVWIALATLTACGGGGSGSGSGPVIDEFTKTIELDGADNSMNNLFSPVVSNRYQFLFRAQELNGSGYISSISFQYNYDLVASVHCPNETIKIGQTNVTNLATTYAANVETGQGSLVTVLDNASVDITPGVAGEYFTINLAKPFYANGVDNLIVEVSRTAACTDRVVVDAGIAAMSYLASLFNDSDASAAMGNAFTNAPSIRFNFTGGDNFVTAADGSIENGGVLAPGDTGRAQFLILASDIVGSGPLTGIQFTPTATLANPLTATYKVTLSHVDPMTTELVDTYATNVGTDATVVTDAVTITVPKGATEWWLPLTRSFNYNGTSNLLIDVVATSVTNGTSVRFQFTGGSRIRASSNPAATEGIDFSTHGLEPKLRFSGGNMDVITANGMSGLLNASFPFTVEVEGRRQHLYLASELGTRGTISKLACRSRSNRTPRSGYNLTVRMSHTTSAVLGGIFSMNLPSVETVFSGSLDTPAMSGGDWIEIPLSTPFLYNGTDNLVIDISGTGPAGPGGCMIDKNAILYNIRQASAGTADATNATVVSNSLMDLRFTITP